MSLLCTSCARANSSVAACRPLQQPSLPLSLLKFIVLILLSFSNLLKFTCFPRSYVKPFKTHILGHSPPNKTKFIHGPKSQSVIVMIVLKSDQWTLYPFLFLHLYQPSVLACFTRCPRLFPFLGWPHAAYLSEAGIGTSFSKKPFLLT